MPRPAYRAERVSAFLSRTHTVRCGCRRFRAKSLRRCPAPFVSCPAAYDSAGCAVPDLSSRSPFFVPFSALSDGQPQPHTKAIIVVLALRGRLNVHRDRILPRQQSLDGFCGDSSRGIVVKPQHHTADMRMLGKIPHQCGGQTAFLDFRPWLVDPGEGDQVFTAPALAVQLLQRPIGQQIHRRLKKVERVACDRRRNSKGIVLVAAVGIPDEVRADPTLVSIAGLAVCVHADEHHIVIRIAFIKAAGLNAEIDQLIIDSSAAQVFDGVGGAAVGLRQKQHLFFRRFRSRVKADGATDRFPIMVSTACVKGISLTLMR